MQLYSKAIDDLVSNASVYELFCLKQRIGHVLESSSQIEQIKNILQLNQQIQYFNSKFNKLIPAIIVEKQIKRVLVKHIQDNSQWWTRYYTINIDGVQLQTPLQQERRKLSKAALSIGDVVGFEHSGEKIIGEIVKLNPKTVKLMTRNDGLWTVHYQYLFQVIDSSNIVDIQLLPAESGTAK